MVLEYVKFSLILRYESYFPLTKGIYTSTVLKTRSSRHELLMKKRVN